MGVCYVCGNDYDKSFIINMDDRDFTFDSFECAIHQLAPECLHCEMKIIGHGVETNSKIYCSAHCARKEGVFGLKDRIETHQHADN